MNSIIKAFSKTPKHLTFFAVICLIIFLGNELIFKNIPSFFDYATTIRELVNNICLAIVTGYIMYVIVNQLKENKDFNIISASLSRSLQEINYINNQLLNEFYKVEKFETDSFPISFESLNQILQKIENTDKLPSISYGYPISKKYTWFQLIQSNKINTISEINKLMRYSHLLNVQLISILNEIEESDFFKLIDQTSIFGKDFKQFTIYSYSYHKLQLINFELLKYSLENNLINENPEIMELLSKIVSGKMSKDEFKSLYSEN